MLSRQRICIGYICIRFRQYNILAWPWIKLATTLVYRVSDKPGVILKYSYGNRKPNTLKSRVVLPILNKWYFSNLVVSANIEIIKFDTRTFYSLHASSPLPTLVGDRVAYSVVSCHVLCRPLLFTYWSFPFWSLYCLSFNLRILFTNWHFRSIVFLFYFNTRI